LPIHTTISTRNKQAPDSIHELHHNGICAVRLVVWKYGLPAEQHTSTSVWNYSVAEVEPAIKNEIDVEFEVGRWVFLAKPSR